MSIIKKCVKFLLWGALRVAAGRETARLRVRRGPAQGVWMELDLRKEGSYWLGTYDNWVLQRIDLPRWVKPGDVAWDCGAYVGYYSAILRRLVGDRGRVVTFEGSSANYRRVARLPIINGWNNVEVRHQAVGLDHSIIEFASNLHGSSGPYGLSKQYADGTHLEIEKVRCAGVDELVYEQAVPAPDFIKFDLESAEEFALHNGQTVFTTKRPVLLLELHGDAAKHAAGRFLETCDYGAWDVLQVRQGTPPLRSADDMRLRPPGCHMLLCLPSQRLGEIYPSASRVAEAERTA